MPAQIYMTHAQLAELAGRDCDVVVTEGSVMGEALDVWLMDGSHMKPDEHHSVVIDQGGTVLSDAIMNDDD